MPARHPIPRTWLMTDERLGAGLAQAIRRLPPSSGIVVRHYSLAPVERRALLRRLRLLAPGAVIVAAGGIGGAGAHNGRRRTPGFATRSVHDSRELRRALSAGADALFLSPLYPTRSHAGAATLPRLRAATLARLSPVPVIALGGMDARRWRAIERLGFHGWAAVDAWARGPSLQKRKAVPTKTALLAAGRVSASGSSRSLRSAR